MYVQCACLSKILELLEQFRPNLLNVYYYDLLSGKNYAGFKISQIIKKEPDV